MCTEDSVRRVLKKAHLSPKGSLIRAAFGSLFGPRKVRNLSSEPILAAMKQSFIIAFVAVAAHSVF